MTKLEAAMRLMDQSPNTVDRDDIKEAARYAFDHLDESEDQGDTKSNDAQEDYQIES